MFDKRFNRICNVGHFKNICFTIYCTLNLNCLVFVLFTYAINIKQFLSTLESLVVQCSCESFTFIIIYLLLYTTILKSVSNCWRWYYQLMHERVSRVSTLYLEPTDSLGINVREWWRALWQRRRARGAAALDVACCGQVYIYIYTYIRIYRSSH